MISRTGNFKGRKPSERKFSKTLHSLNFLELMMLKSIIKIKVWNTIVKVRSLFVGSPSVQSDRSGCISMSNSSGYSGSLYSKVSKPKIASAFRTRVISITS